MSRGTPDPARVPNGFAYGALTPSGRPSQAVRLPLGTLMAVHTPGCTHPGLGCSAFARRYLRNRVFFLFLRVLRCFSSPGSLRMTMDSSYGDMGLPCRVSPFRNLRIIAYVQLPEAYRSLSRLSSALSAKASALCPFCLTFRHATLA